jgi:basic amino acid/polyamine antiporter, APA family
LDPVKPRQLLGVLDATLIVMGAIVGSGIFIKPYVVALRVHTPFLILDQNTVS